MIGEPRLMTSGDGWSVHRLGRSFCVMVEGAEEVWVNRDSDTTRHSLLGALVGGAYGTVNAQTATEACQANWSKQ